MSLEIQSGSNLATSSPVGPVRSPVLCQVLVPEEITIESYAVDDAAVTGEDLTEIPSIPDLLANAAVCPVRGAVLRQILLPE
jgi:hypothetical protein